ncbi:MAG: peroxiredoxin [Pseudodesulfovibrio sp.]|nr:peroxiredoxin [Pseudodesulfovibrio sp.]
MKRYMMVVVFVVGLLVASASADNPNVYPVGTLKPVDSVLKVKVGDPAPDFELPSLAGAMVRLSDFKGRKNVVLSFIPAAWTPVCSDQWPGYNLAQELFDQQNTELIGISVDNIPSQYAWVKEMGGIGFSVVSDFWPHGEVASKYGVLRSSGVSERALFLVDTNGIIRYIDVHDINVRPDLGVLVKEMEKLDR